jgi:pentatricopeptide repeat protein
MQRSGCRPDVVTYTALIGAYERGGEWLRALETFRLVRGQLGAPPLFLAPFRPLQTRASACSTPSAACQTQRA